LTDFASDGHDDLIVHNGILGEYGKRASMGNAKSGDANKVVLNPERNIYVNCLGSRVVSSRFLSFHVFIFSLGHKRYNWKIVKRFHEIKLLHKAFVNKYPQLMHGVDLPPNHYHLVQGQLSNDGLTRRGVEIAFWLEIVGSKDVLFHDPEFRVFLELGEVVYLLCNPPHDLFTVDVFDTEPWPKG
jgi:hypothetical protein